MPVTETLTLDATSELASNVPFELSSDATGVGLVEHSYPAPVPVVTGASSADTEGETLVSQRYPNRVITLTVEVYGATMSTRLAELQSKVAKIAREGGTLKRVTGAVTRVFDLITYQGYEPTFDIAYYLGDVATVRIQFEARPFARSPEVELSSPGWSETTLPALVFTAAAVPGDVPALGRLVVTDGSGVDQDLLVWGSQSRNRSTAATAALQYEAEALTGLNGAASGVVAGASGGSAMVTPTLGSIDRAFMSTKIAASALHMTHVGAYRVMARVLITGAITGAIVALEWATGDLLVRSRNPSVMIPASTAWQLCDLGLVSLPAPRTGAPRWEGRIVARLLTGSSITLNIDHILMVPVDDGYGEIAAVDTRSTPSELSAFDTFDQTAGNLGGKTATIGGIWATSGDVTDFSVDSGKKEVVRATNVADTGSGRLGILGPSLGSVVVEAALSLISGLSVAGGNEVRLGIIARHTNASNYVRAYVLSGNVFPTISNAVVHLEKVIAGVATTVSSIDLGRVLAADYTLRLIIDNAGRFTVQGSDYQQAPVDLMAGYDPVLAAGGTLAAGSTGIYDRCVTSVTAAQARTRIADDFAAYSPIDDSAIFASRSTEIRSDGVQRESATAGVWGPASSYEGTYLRVPPASAESYQSRFVVKASRSRLTNGPDSALDDISARLYVTPRYLVV